MLLSKVYSLFSLLGCVVLSLPGARAEPQVFTGVDPFAGDGEPIPNADAAAGAFEAVAAPPGLVNRIDFEDASSGRRSVGVEVGPGVTVSVTGGESGILTGCPLFGDSERKCPVGYNTTPGGEQFVILHRLFHVPSDEENDPDFIVTGNVTFSFDPPIEAFGAYLTGLDDRETLFVEFDDGETHTLPVVGGGPMFFGFTAPGGSTGIDTVTLRISEPFSGFGVDDVRYAVPGARKDEGDVTPPAAPIGLEAVAEDSRVSLSWADSSEDDFWAFNVYRAEGPGSLSLHARVVESEFQDGEVENGVTYSYSITALDESRNESDVSAEVEGTPLEGVDLSPPEPPREFTGFRGVSEVTLDWLDSLEEDFASYRVSRSETPQGNRVVLQDGLTESEFTDRAVESHVTYYYRVTAIDQSGNESVPSPEVVAPPRSESGTITVSLDAFEADYTDVQSAIDAAKDGDLVIVKPGEYVITESLRFKGKAIHVRSESGPDETTIRMSMGLNGAPSVVLFSSGETRLTELDGFTLTGGGDRDRYGAGVYLDRSSPTLRNCVITKNLGAAGGGGGGVYCEQASPALIGCSITYNMDSFGGGMSCVRNSNPTLENCTIARNLGGGIYVSRSHPTLINCTIVGNLAAESGSGVGVAVSESSGSASATLLNCIVWDHEDGSITHGFSGVTVSYSCVQGPTVWRGAGNINEDPLLCGWDPGSVSVRNQREFEDALKLPFALSTRSPCFGVGIRGTDMGADAEPCDTVGATSRVLRLAAGRYRMAAISLADNVSMQGAGEHETVLEGTVWTPRTGAFLADLTITGGRAGGLRVSGPVAPEIRNCTITMNSTATDEGPDAPGAYRRHHDGGGVSCRSGSSPTFTDCTITKNFALVSGSGFYCSNSAPTLIGCTIRGNLIGRGSGGGVDVRSSRMTLIGCTIIGNSSGTRVRSGLVDLTNCVIAGNGSSGIEISSSGAEARLTNCTIAFNRTRHDPAGVFCDLDGLPAPAPGQPLPIVATVTNSISWGNSSIRQDDQANSLCGDVDRSLSEEDPLFVSEGVIDVTRRISVDFGYGWLPDYIVEEPDFYLQAGSPAIDAGRESAAPPTDIENNERPCGRGVDLGAYEHCGERPRFRRGDVNADGTVNLTGDGLLDAVMTRVGASDVVVFRATAPGELDARIVIPLEASPRDLISIDADGDGLTDLIALGTGSITLLTGDDREGFASPVVQEFLGRAFQSMTAADFDGDGKRELALIDLATARLVIAFLDDAGLVRRTRSHSLPALPSQLTAADFDGDGIADVAVADQAAPVVTVVLRPGLEGEAEMVEVPVGSGQATLTSGDLNGDGREDLAVAARAGLEIRLGDGAGRFPGALSIGGFEASRGLRIADVDGDGAAQLVVATSRGRLAVLSGVREGAHPVLTEIDIGGETRLVDVFDLDLDGRLDLLTATDRSVVVVRGAGESAFSTPERFGVGFDPRAIVFDDVDRDGRPDLVTADFASSGLSILRGAAPCDAGVPFRRGDANLDGVVGITDAVAILERLFSGGAALACPDAADVDDDGELALTDAVRALLYLFGSGEPPPPPGPEVCGADPVPDQLGACRNDCQ